MPGVEVFASQANFILFRVAGARGVWQRLYDESGILLRDFSAARGLADCLRVSIGTPRENDEFLDALQRLTAEAVEGEPATPSPCETVVSAPTEPTAPALREATTHGSTREAS
jgi:hypothetical protein